jgi:hypothetical protein
MAPSVDISRLGLQLENLGPPGPWDWIWAGQQQTHGLDQVQRSLASAATRTIFADSRHNQAVAGDAKIVLKRHGIANLPKFVTAKLNQLIALLTM